MERIKRTDREEEKICCDKKEMKKERKKKRKESRQDRNELIKRERRKTVTISQNTKMGGIKKRKGKNRKKGKIRISK